MLILYVFISILKPAYYSMIVDCIEDGEDIIDNNGYYVVGETAISTKNRTLTNNTIEITILSPDNYITLYKNSTKVLKHELCHYYQFVENRMPTCNNLSKVYLIEVECYIKEKLPIYNREIKEYIKNTNIALV